MVPEMAKLCAMLSIANIQYEIFAYELCGEKCFQVCHPSKKDKKVDAICTQFTYGGKSQLMEVFGSVNPRVENDDVVGWLDAAHAFQYFVSDS